MPLLITADEDLRATISAAAYEAGLRVQTSRDPATALQRWTQPTAVLVGADLTPGLRTRLPAPRDHVVTVRLTNASNTAPGSASDGAARITNSLGPGSPPPSPWPILSPAEAIRYLQHRFVPGRDEGIIIGVISGVGGAGATVTAAAIAAAGARRGGRTVLIDLDPLGGGIDRRLGLHTVAGARWPDARMSSQPPAAGWLDRLPAGAGVAVLAWPPAEQAALPQGAIRRVLAAARRDAHLVVVDLPRHLTTASRKALGRADHLLLVTIDRQAALGASSAVLDRLARRHVFAATRMTRGAALSAAAVARELDVPSVGPILDDPAARADPIDLHALVNSAIGTFAGGLLGDVSIPPDQGPS